MAEVVLKIDGRFKKRLRTVFNNYKADVGVLVDKPHRNALRGVKSLAGGPARKTGRKASTTVSAVSARVRRQVDFLRRPFKIKSNREILRFTKSFLQLFLRGETTKKRVENLLQAIVRNPILRGEYGSNSPRTARIKGFNRRLIDTGQLFKNIKARIVGRGSV